MHARRAGGKSTKKSLYMGESCEIPRWSRWHVQIPSLPGIMMKSNHDFDPLCDLF